MPKRNWFPSDTSEGFFIVTVGGRNPKQPPGMYQTLVNNGISTTNLLNWWVDPGFRRNHQQYILESRLTHAMAWKCHLYPPRSHLHQVMAGVGVCNLADCWRRLGTEMLKKTKGKSEKLEKMGLFWGGASGACGADGACGESAVASEHWKVVGKGASQEGSLTHFWREQRKVNGTTWKNCKGLVRYRHNLPLVNWQRIFLLVMFKY